MNELFEDVLIVGDDVEHSCEGFANVDSIAKRDVGLCEWLNRNVSSRWVMRMANDSIHLHRRETSLVQNDERHLLTGTFADGSGISGVEFLSRMNRMFHVDLKVFFDLVENSLRSKKKKKRGVAGGEEELFANALDNRRADFRNRRSAL